MIHMDTSQEANVNTEGQARQDAASLIRLLSLRNLLVLLALGMALAGLVIDFNNGFVDSFIIYFLGIFTGCCLAGIVWWIMKGGAIGG